MAIDLVRGDRHLNACILNVVPPRPVIGHERGLLVALGLPGGINHQLLPQPWSV